MASSSVASSKPSSTPSRGRQGGCSSRGETTSWSIGGLRLLGVDNADGFARWLQLGRRRRLHVHRRGLILTLTAESGGTLDGLVGPRRFGEGQRGRGRLVRNRRSGLFEARLRGARVVGSPARSAGSATVRERFLAAAFFAGEVVRALLAAVRGRRRLYSRLAGQAAALKHLLRRTLGLSDSSVGCSVSELTVSMTGAPSVPLAGQPPERLLVAAGPAAAYRPDLLHWLWVGYSCRARDRASGLLNGANDRAKFVRGSRSAGLRKLT